MRDFHKICDSFVIPFNIFLDEEGTSVRSVV